MTIIVFLVDTSASMNQRTYLGTTLLDVAKWTVENFMKIRSRDPASRMDRYMLLTFEDPPANVKAGWKESHSTFTNELKNLKASGLTTLGPALKHTFDLLNVNRMQSGIDTYGQGRFPFYLEPAVIMCVTDGRKLTSQGSIVNELNLPMNNLVPGSELTKEPFRWDQRLFGLVLRIPAVPPIENQATFIASAEDSSIDAMCEVTGGRSYAIGSQRMLMQCLESLVQKVQAGVVINFEKTGPDPSPVNVEGGKDGVDGNSKENQDTNRQDGLNGLQIPLEDERKKRTTSPVPQNTAWQNCRRLIYVQRSAQKGYSVGNWPIPESFWPDLNSPSLPPRSSHPVVKFLCTPCDPMAIENFPFDKYEMEPSPMTQYILERRQPNVAWQVYVSNSAKYSDIGHPFGYLKASSNLSSVNLFVMPYNYPILLPLLDELFKVHKMKPTQKWRMQFDSYLKTMPVYYAQPLRRALHRIGVSNLVPDQMDNCLSYSVVSYLKKLKNQAKIEYERLVASVGQRTAAPEGIQVVGKSQTSILQRADFSQLLELHGGDLNHLKQELKEYNTFTLAVKDPNLKSQTYRNPFDITRKDLLDQVARMRANFLHTSTLGTRLQDEDQLHSIPVQQMGNYQEYLKKQPSPLRELETAPVRQHMFGNPFKVNKDLMIDEADEAMPGQQTSSRKRSMSPRESPPSSPGPRKRRPGPLPKDTPYRRPSTPSPTPLSTPNQVNEKLKEEIKAEPPDLPKLEITVTPPSPLPNNHIKTESVHTAYNNGVKLENNIHENHQGDESEYMDTSIKMPVDGRISQKKLSAVMEHNVQLRQVAIREVKRPGRDFKALFGCLEKIQGTLEMRCSLLRDVKRVAERFKRKALLQLLEQFEESMIHSEVRRPKTLNALHTTHKASPTR